MSFIFFKRISRPSFWFISFSFLLCLGSLLVWSPVQAEMAAAPVEGLLDPQPLPDVWMGRANAPVTLVEYASLTCPHCANFSVKVFPLLKSEYIDSGKARFTLRDFPLDPLATAASMIGQCLGGEQRQAFVELLFAQQERWAFVDKPFANLQNLVKQTGIGQETIDKCLKDQDLYEKLSQTKDKATKDFSITGTPTLFINGRKIMGELTLDNLKKEIDGVLTITPPVSETSVIPGLTPPSSSSSSPPSPPPVSPSK